MKAGTEKEGTVRAVTVRDGTVRKHRTMWMLNRKVDA